MEIFKRTSMNITTTFSLQHLFRRGCLFHFIFIFVNRFVCQTFLFGILFQLQRYNAREIELVERRLFFCNFALQKDEFVNGKVGSPTIS